METMLKSSRMRHDDRGAAMVMSAIVGTIVLALGAVMMSYADRESSASNNDRMRQHAIDAAMAGTVVANSALATNQHYAGTTGNWFEGVAQFDVTVTIDPAAPDGFRRIVTAVGYAPSKTSAVVTRTVRQVVELDPVQFEYGVFAEGNYGDGSSATVVGSIYTGGNLSLGNAHDYIGDIYARGAITTGANQTVTGNLHANGNVNVTRTSSSVLGSAYAGGNILTGGTIRDTAQAGGSIGCSKVLGTCIPYSPPPQVPDQHLPTFTWDPANYLPLIVQERSGADVVAAARADNGVSGVYHVVGNVLFSKNDALRMSGPLTIVATGDVSLPGFVTNIAAPTNVQLTVIAMGNVTVANNITIPSSVTVLAYTVGDFSGKNSSTLSGVIYSGGNIDLGANGTVTHAPVDAPGFDWTHANPQSFTVRNVSTSEITGS